MLLQAFSLVETPDTDTAFLGYVHLPDGVTDTDILYEVCDQLGIDADLDIQKDPETGIYLLSWGGRFLYSLEEVLLDST